MAAEIESTQLESSTLATSFWEILKDAGGDQLRRYGPSKSKPIQKHQRCVDPATFSLDPGESTRLKVSFTPNALGERLGRVLLVSNDVKDKARPLTFKGQGALKNIDLSSITRVIATRKDEGLPLPVGWNNTPIVQKDETKIDVAFDIPDSLREALVGRESPRTDY